MFARTSVLGSLVPLLDSTPHYDVLHRINWVLRNALNGTLLFLLRARASSYPSVQLPVFRTLNGNKQLTLTT